jgi:lysophospholipase L1-like esterase
MDRRFFLRNTAVAGATAFLLPEIVKAAIPEASFNHGNHGHQLSKGETILFQGDSITDCGRSRGPAESIANDQKQLGYGYALFAAAQILADNPEKELKIYNRGISGNKVFQLAERWDKDCIDLKPDVLSILIGVNDFWHTKTSQYTGTVEIYLNDYEKLIERTQKALPNTHIIILEPYIIHGGTALDNTWESDFAPYRDAAKKVAANHDLNFIPLQSVFNEALKAAPAPYWGPDGVHPATPAGAQLIAQAWIKAALKF